MEKQVDCESAEMCANSVEKLAKEVELEYLHVQD